MRKIIKFKANTSSSTGRRGVGVYCLIMLGFSICFLKLLMINIDDYASVADVKTSKSLILGESRGVIYDCRLKRLVGREYDYVCAVKPGIKSAEVLRRALDTKTYVNVVDTISKGNPAGFISPCLIENEDIVCAKIYKRYNSSQLATHLIGYVNSENVGVAGIEKAYESLLESYSGKYQVRFFADGTGRIMDGTEFDVNSQGYNSDGGVVLTVDSEFQFVLENAMDSSEIKKGAAVLIEIESGGIRAIVSRPDYNPSDLERYLDDNDSPLFNRSLAAYPVGSVFKPLVAASALEQGLNPEDEYVCMGAVRKNNAEFNCTKAHGTVNMATALMYSCNCYFVNLIDEIDYAQTLDDASSIGFGRSQELCDGLETHRGNLPAVEELNYFAARANFSFGQGSLNATLLQVASLYAAVANGGEYYSPYIVEGECDENGVFVSTHKHRSPHKVFSKKTADTIAACLELTVREGTGENAKTEKFDVAGKTATAQTGDFLDGEERLVTWFAGFFPYDAPKYVLVVMCEDGESGSNDCAPVFSKVASMFDFGDK